MVGRVGTSLIAESDHIHKLLYQLVKDNPDAFDSPAIPPVPDQHRDPRHRFADPDGAAGDEARTPGACTFHSIIGSLPPDRHRPDHRRRGSLSQLPHRPIASSSAVVEKVVRSDHGVQKAPEAIREVRRHPARARGPRPGSAASRRPAGRRECRPGAKLEPPTTRSGRFAA